MNRSGLPARPRSRLRPATVAPIIPLWGLLAFIGVQQFGGTRWLAPFLAFITLAFLGLFGFVARQALNARRLRQATRKLGR